MIDTHFLRDLEQSLFRPEIRASVNAVDRLLADDFVEFGSSGHAFDKREVIEALRSEPAMQRTLVDFRVQQLADDVVLLTYRSIRRDISGDRQFLRSSIWKNIDGQW